MRVSEVLTYFLGACLAVAYGFQEFLIAFVLVGIILIVVLVGAILEGVRFFQWFFLVAFISQIVLVVMDVYSVIALAIYCTFLSISVFACILFGMGDFNAVKKLIDKGPY
jgi:hypothetical protein